MEEEMVYGEALELERGSIHSFRQEHIEERESNPIIKEGYLTKLNAKNGQVCMSVYLSVCVLKIL